MPTQAETMVITEADARLILEEISDTDMDVPEESLSLAKRLVDHFKITDFDKLFTRAADTLAILENFVVMVPIVDCFHTSTKPTKNHLGIVCANCGKRLS